MSKLTSIPADHVPVKANDIQAYLKSKYLLDVSRMTVYNWMNRGRQGEKLKYVKQPAPPSSNYVNFRVSSQQWIDDFLHRSGMFGPKAAAQPASNGDTGAD